MTFPKTENRFYKRNPVSETLPPSRLNGGDSQFYDAICGSRRTSLCLCHTPLNRARTENALFRFDSITEATVTLQQQCRCTLKQTVHEQRPFVGVNIFSFRAIAYSSLHRWTVECVTVINRRTWPTWTSLFIFISPYR